MNLSGDISLAGFASPSKILFCSEGNPAALLVAQNAGRRKTKPMQFAQAEAALAWCRGHGAILVYMPLSLEAN